MGGAVDLITACDLRYCTDDTKFSIKETDLAIVADIGTLQRLPKLIGDQQTRELAYTGRTVEGKEAKELGLVLKAFPEKAQLDAHVAQVAALIAEKSPLTIRGIKQTVLFGRDHSVSDSLHQVKMLNTGLLFNNDLKEAMQAMVARAKPTFK
jgi:enoyl-CoA hydratase